jgi:hypothetical protein
VNNAYSQPWFLLYNIVICALIFSSVWFGVFTIILSCIPMILVDLGKWPKSKEWIEMSSKFRSRHRVFVGGIYLITIFSYVFIGPDSIIFNLIIIGIIAHWIELLIRIDI